MAYNIIIVLSESTRFFVLVHAWFFLGTCIGQIIFLLRFVFSLSSTQYILRLQMHVMQFQNVAKIKYHRSSSL